MRVPEEVSEPLARRIGQQGFRIAVMDHTNSELT